MKTIYLVPILLFFCSCYSYKQAAIPTFEKGKFYKFTMQNKESIKVQVLSVKQDSLLVTDHFKNFNIATENIKEVKKRKFSYAKTISTPLGVLAIIGGAVYIVGSNIRVGGFNGLQSPP